MCFLLKGPFVLLVCQGTHVLKDSIVCPIQESTAAIWPRLTDLNAAFSQSIWINKTDCCRLGSYRCQVWGRTPVNPALRILRQGDQEFQDSLHYTVGPKPLIRVDIWLPQFWSLGGARSSVCQPCWFWEGLSPSSTNGHVLAVSCWGREQDNRPALLYFSSVHSCHSRGPHPPDTVSFQRAHSKSHYRR